MITHGGWAMGETTRPLEGRPESRGSRHHGLNGGRASTTLERLRLAERLLLMVNKHGPRQPWPVTPNPLSRKGPPMETTAEQALEKAAAALTKAEVIAGDAGRVFVEIANTWIVLADRLKDSKPQ